LLIKVEDFSTKVLDIGCGPNKTPGAVGLDIRAGEGVDIVHDLNRYPWPFEDNSFDVVIANHCLEHLEDVVRAVEECYRILRPGGIFTGKVPHFSSCDFWTDPTHRHAFASRSFDYFIEGTKLFNLRYSCARFRARWIKLHTPVKNPVRALLLKLINKYPFQYERKFAFILPVGTVEFELEAVK